MIAPQDYRMIKISTLEQYTILFFYYAMETIGDTPIHTTGKFKE